MTVKRRLRRSLSRLGFRKKVALAALLVLLVSLPLILHVTQQRQDVRQQAAEKFVTTSRTYDELIKEKKIKPASEILEINLAYDEELDPQVKVISTQRKIGYAPYQKENDGMYTFELRDKEKRVLHSMKFDIPNEVESPPPLDPNEEPSKPIILKKVNFTLTVPWYPQASELRILDSQRQLLVAQPILNIPKVENKPKFRSIEGDEVLELKKQNFINVNFIKETFAQTATDGFVDIVFIGDDYVTQADLDRFHQDVARMTTHLLTYEPFRSRAHQLRFNFVDNMSDLECAQPVNTRLIICNGSKVVQTVNSAGVVYDEIVVIINTSNYGGCGCGSYATTYNGTFGEMAFVHEFGHTFAALWDEYTVYATDGLLDGRTKENCYAGNPPAAEWQTIVASRDYTLGCYFRNWYRSSRTSLMYGVDTNSLFFNAVSQQILNQRIDAVAGPYADSSAPSSSVSYPQDGAIVTGTVTVTTFLSDNRGIAYAQLWIDGTLYTTTYLSPFYFSWATNEFANGQHTIHVKAYNVAGNMGSSALYSVTIEPTPSPTPTPPDACPNSTTFGKTTTGSTVRPFGSNLWGSKYTLSTSGNLTKVKAYLQWDGSGSSNVRTIIYADNGGIPGQRLGQSEIRTFTTTPSWVEFSFSPAISLNAGTYWLSVLGQEAGMYGYSDLTGESNQLFGKDNASWPDAPNPASVTGYGSEALSIYGTVCTSPTPTSTPTPTPTRTPTPTPSNLPADINRDGCIGILDFNAWLRAMQTGTPFAGTYPDVNQDGRVDILDFNLWLIAMRDGVNLCL